MLIFQCLGKVQYRDAQGPPWVSKYGDGGFIFTVRFSNLPSEN